MCTSLVPEIGYDKAAQIAYEAFNTNKTIKQVLKDNKVLSDQKIDNLLNPKLMIKPKIVSLDSFEKNNVTWNRIFLNTFLFLFCIFNMPYNLFIIFIKRSSFS